MKLRSVCSRLVLALVLGCLAGKLEAASTPPPEGEGPASPPCQPTLLEKLKQEIGMGQPVALLPGKEGLLAVSADGSRKRTLIKEPITSALLDELSQSVWYIQKRSGVSSVYLLDLLKCEVTPEPILTKLVEAKRLIVASKKRANAVSAGDWRETAAILILDPAAPHLEAEADVPAVFYGEGEASVAKHEKKIRSSTFAQEGMDRLRTIAQRRSQAPTPVPLRKNYQVKAVPEEACADTGTDCGRATAMPRGNLWLVLVHNECGDACYPDYQLYDPATKVFLDPANPKSRRAAPLKKFLDPIDAWQSPDGSSLIKDGVLYSLSAGIVARNQGGTGGNWLEGGLQVK